MTTARKVYLSVDRCPQHREFWAVSVSELDDEGCGHGSRLSGEKCCGQWKTVKSWTLNADECRAAIAAFTDALACAEAASSGEGHGDEG